MQANHVVKRKITTYDIVVTALFAAICYVATAFFHIDIPTPLGKTMMHFGNIFCLLSAMLMGGLRGGIADATGLTLFDLTGGWATSAPSTFVMRFVMGLVCGSISTAGRKKEKRTLWMIISAVTGMATYIVLYLSYSFLKGIVLGNAVGTVLVDVASKAATSVPAGCVSVVVAVVLYPFFYKALTAAGYYQKRA